MQTIAQQIGFHWFWFCEHPMAVFSDGDRHHFFVIFSEKMQDKFAGFEKMRTFASAIDKNA